MPPPGFFTRALVTLKVTPTEVVTDAAPVDPRALDELIPAVQTARRILYEFVKPFGRLVGRVRRAGCL